MTAIGDDARRVLQGRANTLEADALRSLSPLLVIVPHPDDETLGCGGLVAEASDHGLDVRIVYVTDGAASHTGSPTWPPQRLARTRRAEALAALAALGVGAEDVFWLDWPDAAPHPSGSAGFERAVETLLGWRTGLPARSLWAPYRDEGHCDHQAGWALAAALRRRSAPPPPRLFEYLVWGWSDPGVCASLERHSLWRLPCERQIARRRRALACHATQLGGLIDDAAEAFALPPALTALTECAVEIFVER